VKRLPLLLLVAAVAALALTVSAAPAAAKTPCWSLVINDWYDNGRIDHEYSVACYQAALKHLPPDVQEYADAQDVIKRAMTAAIIKKSQDKGGDNNTGGNGDNQNRSGAPSSGGGGDNNDGGGTATPGTSDADGDTNADHPGLITKAFNRLGPGNADSIPIPLIVLGSLALLLLAAGAAGMVARKLQERQPKPATVPQRASDGPAV
jgi:hypothetical protein